MSSQPVSVRPHREEVLLAAEQRAQADPPPMNIRQLAHIHDLKQHFRRLIDPGIMRPNNQNDALLALKTLETLSDNLLREPGNEKFRSFKSTNSAIKKRLVDVKGGLEYAVEMGFHLKVESFQPLYVFNDRHLEELRIGNEILKETLAREAEKAEKASHSKLSEKELREIARRNVQQQFHEDRLKKQEKDRREAEQRAARAVTSSTNPPSPTHVFPDSTSGGVTLSGRIEPTISSDEGPVRRRVPYQDDGDESE